MAAGPELAPVTDDLAWPRCAAPPRARGSATSHR